MLLNNAGIGLRGTSWNGLENWKKIFDVNIYGYVPFLFYTLFSKISAFSTCFLSSFDTVQFAIRYLRATLRQVARFTQSHLRALFAFFHLTHFLNHPRNQSSFPNQWQEDLHAPSTRILNVQHTFVPVSISLSPRSGYRSCSAPIESMTYADEKQ